MARSQVQRSNLDKGLKKSEMQVECVFLDSRRGRPRPKTQPKNDEGDLPEPSGLDIAGVSMSGNGDIDVYSETFYLPDSSPADQSSLAADLFASVSACI